LDFTLTFEESILSILPTAVLTIAATLQVAFLFGRPRLVGNGNLLWMKQASGGFSLSLCLVPGLMI
jgi:hypothetical protein